MNLPIQDALFYKLDAHTPVPLADVDEWIEWTRAWKERTVAVEWFGDGFVSTAHVGLALIQFETIFFSDGEIVIQRRYDTWDEAAAGHEEICKPLRTPNHETTQT